MTKPAEPALDTVKVLKAAADDRRALLLQLMQHESYSVSELVDILKMAQPAISHHLKILRQAGYLNQRREANSIYYRRAQITEQDLRSAIMATLDEANIPPDVQRRATIVQEQRQHAVQSFFQGNADALRSQQLLISETSVYATTLQDMWRAGIQANGRALEVGPGDGQVLALMADDFTEVLGIDLAEQMLENAEDSVAHLSNVRLRHQDFNTLADDQRFDTIVAAMVLHHLPSPRSFFARAANLLNDDGMVLVAELARHEHDWVREACGDVWLGFETQEIDAWAKSCGLQRGAQQYLAQKNGFSINLLSYGRQSVRYKETT